jgi:hypothetical protein
MFIKEILFVRYLFILNIINNYICSFILKIDGFKKEELLNKENNLLKLLKRKRKMLKK